MPKSKAEIEERARELYDEQQVSKPAWDQLGWTTQCVWLEKAEDGLTPEGRESLIPIPRDSQGKRIK